MEEFYKIIPGNVKKYISKKRESNGIIKSRYAVYCFVIIVAFLFTYLVFIQCISPKKKLSDTIALGSIFATFGSSLVAVFSLIMGSTYDRFLSNINILFQKLEPEKAWYRWAFIKRKSHQILYNREYAYQELTNAKIYFNVGSHKIDMFLPTIKEDFFDLPNWKSWNQMRQYARDYEHYILNKCIEPAIPLMIWDCVWDNFCVIIKYKFARILVLLGDALIISSVFWSFVYGVI